MLAEKDCPREHRFLFADIRFGKAAIAYWKEVCKQKQAEGMFEQTVLSQKYLNWEASEKEVSLFTKYAYADLQIPKSFSCIFDVNNPENAERTALDLKQSIFEAWYPIDYLDHGHKHLCVFQFQDNIPALINEIEEIEGEILSKTPSGKTVGICQWEDFPYIKKSLKNKSS